MKTPKDVLADWVLYMNTHDANKLSQLYHTDAINLQVAVGHPLNGRAAIKKDFEAFFESNPDTGTKVENIFTDGEWVMLEWICTGTFKATGKNFFLKGCGFFHVVGEKIIFQRGYWDKHTWFTQVGLPLNDESFS